MVVWMSEWPISFWTVGKSTPDITRCEANVWRSVCTLTARSAAYCVNTSVHTMDCHLGMAGYSHQLISGLVRSPVTIGRVEGTVERSLYPPAYLPG